MIGLEPNLFAMLFGVQFCRFACVMGGVMHMSLGTVGVVSGFFVSARLIMLGGFFVVTCGMLVISWPEISNTPSTSEAFVTDTAGIPAGEQS
jgi:hypothetical protein